MPVTKKTPLYFAEQGHDVTFMTHSELTEKPARINDLHERINVLRFELPFRWFAVPKLRRIRQLLCFTWCCLRHTLRLRRQGRKPELIYAAECDAILIGRLLASLFQIPLVTRYYGVSTQLAARPLKHPLYALCLRVPADLAIVTDDGTGGLEAIQRANKRLGRICFWRNGLDQVPVDPENVCRLRSLCRRSADDLLLMTVSRLYGWKRIDRALRTLACLVHDHQRKVRLAIVGHGPQRDDLEQLARDLQVVDHVTFLGAVPAEQIADVYQASDIFLGLSEMSNVGNTLWEAMRARRCVVTLDTGETGEVIQEGVNGRLLDPLADEAQLAQALAAVINELIDDPQQRERLAHAGYEYVRQHLQTWDERFQAELAVLVEVANRERSPDPVHVA